MGTLSTFIYNLYILRSICYLTERKGRVHIMKLFKKESLEVLLNTDDSIIEVLNDEFEANVFLSTLLVDFDNQSDLDQVKPY